MTPPPIPFRATGRVPGRATGCRAWRFVVALWAAWSSLGGSPVAAAAQDVAGTAARVEAWAAVSAGPLVVGVAEAWRAEGGPQVRVHTDATSRIVPQVAAGAPADVVVTADRAWMLRAVDMEIVNATSARLVAVNRLALFERSDGSGGVPVDDRPGAAPLSSEPPTLDAEAVRKRLARLSGPGPSIALAGPDVPVGRYAREALSSLGLMDAVRRSAVAVGNARAVVNAVALGELEVGVGYASDALADPAVRVVGLLPADAHAPAEIWAAPVRRDASAAPGSAASGAAESAVALVERLASPDQAERIRVAGFAVPIDRPTLAPPTRPVPAAVSPSAGDPGSSPALWPVVVRSVLVGLFAVLLATLPAVALGRWLARTHSPVRGPVGTVLLLPLVLPPVVTGFVLLALFGSSGVLGPPLAAVGIRLSFTFWAAVLAAAVVGFPLYAVVVRNAFEAVDPRYEELAWTLGATPGSTFRRVALPLALPGVVAGAVLALARGLGEFGATIVVAGNIEGETQTLALAVYRLLESPEGRGRVWLFVFASVVIAAVGLALWEWLTARQRVRLLDGGRR